MYPLLCVGVYARTVCTRQCVSVCVCVREWECEWVRDVCDCTGGTKVYVCTCVQVCVCVSVRVCV